MFRIQQTGPNASGQTHYLSLSGFEIYGNVNGITDDQPGNLLESKIFRDNMLGFSSTLLNE